jgi:hypothetical protein
MLQWRLVLVANKLTQLRTQQQLRAAQSYTAQAV